MVTRNLRFLRLSASSSPDLWSSSSWYNMATGALGITPTFQQAVWRKKEEELATFSINFPN
jgi:hypothetical protein